MSYFGWDGRVDIETANNLLATSDILKHAGIDNLLAASDMLKQFDIDEDLLIDLNDSGLTFDEIADYLDSNSK